MIGSIAIDAWERAYSAAAALVEVGDIAALGATINSASRAAELAREAGDEPQCCI